MAGGENCICELCLLTMPRELCAHAPDVHCGHCKPPEEGEGMCMVSDDQEFDGLEPEFSFFTGLPRENGPEQVLDFFAGTPFKSQSEVDAYRERCYTESYIRDVVVPFIVESVDSQREGIEALGSEDFDTLDEVEERVAQANNQKATKIRMELLPFEALEDVTLAFQVGADKYDRNSWRSNGVPYSVCASALLRHFSKWQSGEDFDQADGQPHMAAIAFYAMVILQYERDGRSELDDRFRRNND